MTGGCPMTNHERHQSGKAAERREASFVTAAGSSVRISSPAAHHFYDLPFIAMIFEGERAITKACHEPETFWVAEDRTFPPHAGHGTALDARDADMAAMESGRASIQRKRPASCSHELQISPSSRLACRFREACRVARCSGPSPNASRSSAWHRTGKNPKWGRHNVHGDHRPRP